jgi:hypothetical protein
MFIFTPNGQEGILIDSWTSRKDGRREHEKVIGQNPDKTYKGDRSLIKAAARRLRRGQNALAANLHRRSVGKASTEKAHFDKASKGNRGSLIEARAKGFVEVESDSHIFVGGL